MAKRPVTKDELSDVITKVFHGMWCEDSDVRADYLWQAVDMLMKLKGKAEKTALTQEAKRV